jgi:hypothetical protein
MQIPLGSQPFGTAADSANVKIFVAVEILKFICHAASRGSSAELIDALPAEARLTMELRAEP